MAQQTLNTIFEKLGGVEAVAREAKHAANGASQKIDVVAGKVDSLALVVATQGQIRDHVDRLEREAKEDRAQIEELKADKYRRQGAIGVAEAFRRYWPLFPIFSLAALFIAWANGKI